MQPLAALLPPLWFSRNSAEAVGTCRSNFRWTRLTSAALPLSGRISRRRMANCGRNGSFDVHLKTICIIALALLVAGCAGRPS
ncbi:MAG: hypothetical protein E5X96_17695, partial [Mesorhizobium sp.]